MAGGKFITFEGGEGSGKSTQARLLAERLKAEGIDVLLTREPGGSPFAERLREVLLDPDTPEHTALSEALLFFAARADHLDKTIRPALAAGRWVVCDRFADSTRVYQGTAGGLPDPLFDALEAHVVAPTVPDLTVFLDLPAEAGLTRARQRRMAAPVLQHANDDEALPGPSQRQATEPEADAYERRGLAFHERLREGFAAIARRDPRRSVVVDAGAAESEIAAAVWAAVASRLLAGSR